MHFIIIAAVFFVFLLVLLINPVYIFNKTKFKVSSNDKGLLPVRFMAAFLLFNLCLLIFDMFFK